MNRCTAPHCRTDGEEPREADPGQTLCQRCRTRLRNEVTAMPSLAAWLHLHLAATGSGGLEPVSGSREAPTPLNLRILGVVGDAARFTVHEGIDPETGRPYRDQEPIPNIRSVLVGWTRVLADHLRTPDGDWPADTIAAMAAWLGGRVTVIAGQGWAADMATEVHDLHDYAWRLAPIRLGRRALYRPCPSCDLLALVLEYVDPDNREDGKEAARARWPRVVCDVRAGGCSRVWREQDYDWLGHVLGQEQPASGGAA